MGMFARLFRRPVTAAPETRGWTAPSAGNEAAWTTWIGAASPSIAGPVITPETAVTLSGVYRAVQLVSEAVAGLPLHLYRRVGDRRERLTDHPRAALLTLPSADRAWSPWQLRKALMVHVLIYGNGYALVRDDRVDLLHAPEIRVGVAGGAKFYTNVKTSDVWRAHEVVHVAGLGFDGLVGKAPIALAAESLGKAIATDRYGATFFGKGGRPSVIIQHPGKMSQQAMDNLRNSYARAVDGGQGTVILEEGMSIKEVSLPPEHAQFIQTARWNMTDVSRWFGVPLPKLSELTDAHYANMEQLATAWAVDTIAPWCQQIETALAIALLTPSEIAEGYYWRHNLQGLMRGDSAARASYYTTMRQWGGLSANEMRALEDMDPYEGGDEPWAPVNMVPASQLGQQVAPSPAPFDEPADDAPRSAPPAEVRNHDPARETRARQTLRKTFTPLVLSAIEAILRREKADIMRAIGKIGPAIDADAMLTEFYRGHEFFADQKLVPVATAYSRAVAQQLAGDELTDAMAELAERAGIGGAKGLRAKSMQWRHAKLVEIVRLATTLEERNAALAAAFDGWTDSEFIGHSGIDALVEIGESAAYQVYKSLGRMSLRWDASGDACEFCRQFDGQVVGHSAGFALAGSVLRKTTGEVLSVSHNVMHPPLHRGCQCSITGA